MMLGSMDKDQFDPEKYDEFYSNHVFEPLPDAVALDADKVLPRVGWALDAAKDTDAKSVLDLCCLDGFASLTLANKLGITAVGVDLSTSGVDLANERADKAGLQADYFIGRVEDYEGEEQSDLCLLFEAIEHFTDPDLVMDTVRKNLKPGGTLLVSTPDAEGPFGIGNDDPAHLRVYSYRETDVPSWDEKPVISLPTYLEEQGFIVEEVNVWGGIIHISATLPTPNLTLKIEGFEATV